MQRRFILLSVSGIAFAALAVSASPQSSKPVAHHRSAQEFDCLSIHGAPPGTFVVRGMTPDTAFGVSCIEFDPDGVCSQWTGGDPTPSGYVTVARVYRGPCGKLGFP